MLVCMFIEHSINPTELLKVVYIKSSNMGWGNWGLSVPFINKGVPTFYHNIIYICMYVPKYEYLYVFGAGCGHTQR